MSHPEPTGPTSEYPTLGIPYHTQNGPVTTAFSFSSWTRLLLMLCSSLRCLPILPERTRTTLEVQVCLSQRERVLQSRYSASKVGTKMCGPQGSRVDGKLRQGRQSGKAETPARVHPGIQISARTTMRWRVCRCSLRRFLNERDPFQRKRS